MSEYGNVIIKNTDDITPPVTSGGLWENREAAYHIYDLPGVPKCSIAVIGYNRLEKTRYCVECILKCTIDIDYELILIDNGSSDGTLEFFESVEYDKKKIIKVTKNIGAPYGVNTAINTFIGKYLVIVTNDVYVTKNWLSNLLKCYESDPKIGFVAPVSSNVSNLQEVDLKFENFNEMQQKAAIFNESDPKKWERRIRLLNIITVFSRPILDIVGSFDPAYVHDFLEDDFAMRIRRQGYKLILCKDTWVCHDHNLSIGEDKDLMAYRASLESGRRIYKEKYNGLDAWDDTNNFEEALLQPIDTIRFKNTNLSSLIIEPRLGTPIFEICNKLKGRDIDDVTTHAFITRAKYFTDLQYAADTVKCDRMDFIQSHYANSSFDIIACCEPINIYGAPITFLQRLYDFLKPGGILLFKLRNTNDYNSLLRAAGLGGKTDADMPSSITPEEIIEILKIFGGIGIKLMHEMEPMQQDHQKELLELLKTLKPHAGRSELTRSITKDFCFKVEKGAIL